VDAIRPTRSYVQTHSADVAMTVMVFVWGFHFIVLKDAFEDVPPLAFNTLRLTLGLPLILLIGLRHAGARVPLREIRSIVLLGLTLPVAYQILMISGIDRTTSTNAALLLATRPVWTALISVAVRTMMINRGLLIGLALAFGGVVLVVLSRAGADLSLSHRDLVGSLMLLGAALFGALDTVVTKPLVDRNGTMAVVVWKYPIFVGGLWLMTAPDMLHLSADSIPADRIPHLLYSAYLAAVGGFLTTNHATRQLGPTRSAIYLNFTPIVAGIAAVALLGESLTISLVIGAALTLWGVWQVRNHIVARPATGLAAPSAAHLPSWGK
jgi:drug/metabolite transporter (DMT)-like permease